MATDVIVCLIFLRLGQGPTMGHLWTISRRGRGASAWRRPGRCASIASDSRH